MVGRTPGAPGLVLILLGLAAPARAGDVVSPGPDAVAVTIYRDGPARTADLVRRARVDAQGLALVVETRAIDLPAGRSRLVFQGVAEGILPQSVALDGLGARLVERDFDRDLLSPATLLAHAVGTRVTVARTEEKTGRELRAPAILVSGPDGVMLDFSGRVEALHCGGERERILFDHAPPGLNDRPTLSVLVDAPRARHVRARLSYLATGLDWSADYVARIARDGHTLDLTGWITLVNRGATGFGDAPTQVVAGHLARIPVDRQEPAVPSVQAHCWPGQTTHAGWLDRNPPPVQPRPPAVIPLAMPPPPPVMARAAMPLLARARVIESNLGDYKLYALAEPTTVAARQTKQVMFLDQPAVTFETVYSRQVVDYAGQAYVPPAPARTVLRFENKAASGLGRALPSGGVQIRQPRAAAGGRDLLVGEYSLSRDVPVGEPFELDLGEASDITVSKTVTGMTPDGRGHVLRDLDVRATNAKPYPVTLEIRHPRLGAPGFQVVAESQPHGLKAGDPLWRLTVPARDAVDLTYRVRLDAH
jgi:hypothetical protein